MTRGPTGHWTFPYRVFSKVNYYLRKMLINLCIAYYGTTWVLSSLQSQIVCIRVTV